MTNKPGLKVYLRDDDLIVSEATGLAKDSGRRWVAINEGDRYVEIAEHKAPAVIAALHEFVDHGHQNRLAMFCAKLLDAIRKYGTRSDEVKSVVRQHEHLDGAHDTAMLLILAAEAKDTKEKTS